MTLVAVAGRTSRLPRARSRRCRRCSRRGPSRHFAPREWRVAARLRHASVEFVLRLRVTSRRSRSRGRRARRGRVVEWRSRSAATHPAPRPADQWRDHRSGVAGRHSWIGSNQAAASRGVLNTRARTGSVSRQRKLRRRSDRAPPRGRRAACTRRAPRRRATAPSTADTIAPLQSRRGGRAHGRAGAATPARARALEVVRRVVALGSTVMLETTIAAVSAEQVRAACGEEPGWFCRNVLDWTENRTLAELADFILGKPITILAILVIAWLVNRIARRGVKGALRTLSSGAVQERMGTPARRHAERAAADQRAQPALRAAHRGAHQRPALAGHVRDLHGRDVHDPRRGRDQPRPADRRRRILGVALGFGSQSLVKDFLSRRVHPRRGPVRRR